MTAHKAPDSDGSEERLIADYVAPNVQGREGTCDCCGEGPKEIVHVDPNTEAYVCVDCYAFHRKALAAAVQKISGYPIALMVADGWSYSWEDVASIIVKEYMEYQLDPEQFDGRVADTRPHTSPGAD